MADLPRIAVGQVLVTGATGFVGRFVVRDLAAAGYDVIGAARGDFKPVPGVAQRHLGDLADSEELESVVRGVEYVVHLAARAHKVRDDALDPEAEFTRVNVEGTRRLAVAAARAGTRRLVFLSTVKAMGETSGASGLRESDVPYPADTYGASKLRAEQVLMETAAEEGLEAVVLRAPLIYGPGVRANMLSLLRIADSPLPLPFGAITGNRRSLIYVGNLASAIRVALKHPAAAGRTFLVRDGEDLSTEGLLASTRRALGRAPHLARLPAWVLRAGLVALGRRSAARRLLESLQIDDSAIRDTLEWRPEYSAEQGLAATAAWYRSARAQGAAAP